MRKANKMIEFGVRKLAVWWWNDEACWWTNSLNSLHWEPGTSMNRANLYWNDKWSESDLHFMLIEAWEASRDMTRYGLMLLDVVGYGGIRRDMTRYGGMLRDVAGCCEIRRDMKGYYGILRNICKKKWWAELSFGSRKKKIWQANAHLIPI